MMRCFGIEFNPDYVLLNEGHSLLGQLRRTWQSETWNLSFYELLYKFRRLDCTDPKDRVYGFLGLVDRSLGFSITSNYELSVSEVYTNVARTLLEKTRTLDILNCKREWRGASHTKALAHAYSLFDQAKYHDTRYPVQDGPGKAVRKTWMRLPPGWERIEKNGTCYFYNWNTAVSQEHSPLKVTTYSTQQ